MGEMVSVIIPTYNRGNYILRAVESVLNQTYSAFELIIVDDGSQDNTQEVIAQIRDDRVCYIKLETNEGLAHALNRGVKESKYDYIAICDSDDEWLPNKLELQMKKMMESPEDVALVYCRMGGKRRNSEEEFVCPSNNIKASALEGDIFIKLLQRNVIGNPALLVKKKCFEAVGGFKEALQRFVDWEFVLRIAQRWKIAFVDEILVTIHRIDGSVSTNMGAYFVSRCYMVSLYRQEMQSAGILNEIKEEILDMAKKIHAYEEIRELLNRDIEL